MPGQYLIIVFIPSAILSGDRQTFLQCKFRAILYFWQKKAYFVMLTPHKSLFLPHKRPLCRGYADNKQRIYGG